MAESLRILILEDNPADAELIQYELQEAGLAFTANVVKTEKDFVLALQEFSPDLILSDHDLPRYNGVSALAEARRRRPDTPFILVSGAVTEDRAIEILTQGAKDYVLKTRIEQRLVPAVRRVLAEAEEHRLRKQAEAELHEAHRSLEEKVRIRTAELEAEIAARKKTEEALRESEERFRSYFELGLIGMAITSPTKGFIEVNDEICRILGYKRHDLRQKTWAELTHPDDLAIDVAHFNRVLAGEIDGYSVDKRFIRKNGDIIHATISVKCVHTADGSVDYFVALIQDISERKRAEEAMLRGKHLSEALNRINDALHSTLDPGEVTQRVVDEGAVALGSDTAVISLREGDGWTVSHIHGMPANMVGMRMTDDQERHATLAFQSCQPVVVSDAFNDDRFNREHLRKLNVRALLVAPLIIKGNPFGVLFFNYHAGPHAFTQEETAFARQLAAAASIAMENARLFDEIRHAEEALKEQTRQLEEINQELESFSYSASHDLRAPLRAIDGYSRMILRQRGGTFDENTKQQFTVIRDNVKIMEQLIEDLLALSRLGREALSLSQLNMEELTRNVWGELKAGILDRPVDLKIDPLPPGMGDRSLIGQVLVNLLSNAVKFSRVREVPLIEVGGYGADSENVYYVRDNGVGFDMQYHDKLFGVFQRLHSAAEFEGTGVGLTIVQRIIQRHGGRVWAEGKVGEGACFYFTLRRA